jgi:hypothetical protein
MGLCCRDLILPLFPLFLFLEDVRTEIFDTAEYIIMEWTMPNESRIYRRVHILKRKRRVLLASLPQSSIGQKRMPGLKK